MDSHETWAPEVGGGRKRRRCPLPLKIHENKRFAIYSSLVGFFLPCEGLSSTIFFFYLWRLFSPCWGIFATFFTLWEAFLAMWGLFFFFFLYRGPFSYVGGLFWLAPHPTKISESTNGPCHDINLNVKFVENVSTSA